MAQAPIGDEGGPRDCMGCGGKVCGICATEFRPHEDVMCHICRQNPPDPEATASWVLGTSVGEERENLNASLLALEEETRRMENQALMALSSPMVWEGCSSSLRLWVETSSCLTFWVACSSSVQRKCIASVRCGEAR